MKLRNRILAMAVVAVAGVNVYLANDIQVQKNSLSLLNLENIAEAGDGDGDGDGDVDYGYVVRRWCEPVYQYGVAKCAEYSSGIVKKVACEGKNMQKCTAVSDDGDTCPAYGNMPHNSWITNK